MNDDPNRTIDEPTAKGRPAAERVQGDPSDVRPVDRRSLDDDDTDDHTFDDQRSERLTDTEIVRVRAALNDGTLDQGAGRVKWFLFGFLAALLALVVASLAFLVVSDDDNDGEVDLDVPTVDVDG